MKWEDFPGPEGGPESGAIGVPNFSEHVHKMHADSDAGFAKEYSEIQKQCLKVKHNSDQSSHPDNKCKNRYLNIVACKNLFNVFFKIRIRKYSGPNLNKNIFVFWKKLSIS